MAIFGVKWGGGGMNSVTNLVHPQYDTFKMFVVDLHPVARPSVLNTEYTRYRDTYCRILFYENRSFHVLVEKWSPH